MSMKSRMIGAVVGAVFAAGLGSAGVALAQEVESTDTTSSTDAPAETETKESTAKPEDCEDREGGGPRGGRAPRGERPAPGGETDTPPEAGADARV